MLAIIYVSVDRAVHPDKGGHFLSFGGRPSTDVSRTTRNQRRAKEKVMNKPPRRPKPFPQDSLRKYHEALTQQAASQNKHQPKVCDEIETALRKLEFIQKPRIGSKAYEATARVIYALKVGLVNCPDVMSRVRADSLRRFMTGRFRFSHAQVNGFLTRKFSKFERLLLYQRLDDNFNPDYGGLRGCPKDLVNALWSYSGSGFSLLCKVWLEPPRPRVVPAWALK